MRYIDDLTDNLEESLRETLKNQTLFQLFELERSMVYFITALRDNLIVIQKVMRLRLNYNYNKFIQVNETDEELFEDAVIETKQAIEMVEMHSNILSSMMDAFASIISNNLNFVMKFLASITILLAIPTMIASFWGMNVDVPWKDHAGGFIHISTFSAVLTALALFWLWRKKMI